MSPRRPNSCQLKNRTLQSPGANPCAELETRGGISLYDANKTNQTFSPIERNRERERGSSTGTEGCEEEVNCTRLIRGLIVALLSL